MLGVATTEDEAGSSEGSHVLWVNLIAMTEAFAHDVATAKDQVRQGAAFDLHVLTAKTHGATHDAFDLLLIGQFADDGVRGSWVKFSAVGIGPAEDIACVFDHCHLETEANA